MCHRPAGSVEQGGFSDLAWGQSLVAEWHVVGGEEFCHRGLTYVVLLGKVTGGGATAVVTQQLVDLAWFQSAVQAVPGLDWHPRRPGWPIWVRATGLREFRVPAHKLHQPDRLAC